MEQLLNDRAFLREYAKSKGRETTGFLRIENGKYSEGDNFWADDILITIDNKGKEERPNLDYKELFHFAVRNFKFYKK